MKKLNFVFILLIASSFSACASEISLVRIMNDGQRVVSKYPANTKNLVLYDSDMNGLKTIGFEGIENFTELETLELQNLPFLQDFSFLSRLKHCRELYVCTGSYFDFRILTNVSNLEVLEFSGKINENDLEEIMKFGIDLSFLTHLRQFIFQPSNVRTPPTIKIRYAKE